jgi:hypothetical protein
VALFKPICYIQDFLLYVNSIAAVNLYYRLLRSDAGTAVAVGRGESALGERRRAYGKSEEAEDE